MKEDLSTIIERIKAGRDSDKKVEAEIREIEERLRKSQKTRLNLERGVIQRVIRGEQLPDPLLDYCFRHFTSPTPERGVLDFVEDLRLFYQIVSRATSQKILTVQGSLMEAGIISGNCKFVVEDKFRYLYVPVERAFVYDSGNLDLKWKKPEAAKNKRRVWVNQDIFTHPHPDENRPQDGVWKTCHRKELYTGGGPPADTYVYVGNRAFEEGFQRHCNITRKSVVKIQPPKQLSKD